MLRYLIKRATSLLVALVVASAVIFALVEVVPGDPASFMLGINAQEDTLAALRAELGLNGSLLERYFSWIGGMVRGDFGTSYTYRTDVAGMVADRLQVSLPLALYALALSMAIAFPAGIWAAARRGRAGDLGVMAATQLGVAVPNFWFAILLILLFSVHLQWFSAGGFAGWGEDFGEAMKSLLLPAISLAVVQAAILARITRSAVLEVLREDFVRTARAKGLSERATLWGHVLRNAMIPVVTVMGLQFGNLITSAIVIENVFVLPGIGRLIFQAIANRDLIVVRDVVMLLSAMVILINFLIDLLYAWIDPRLKTGGTDA